MKKSWSLLLFVLSLTTFPPDVIAAEISVDSTTLFGISKRDVAGTSSKETLYPATQFVGLSAYKLADGNLSLQLYGWGRTDLADNSYNSEKSVGNVTYGYLQYRLPKANTNIRAGRFFVREGIINEHVDGIAARTDLPFGFGLSAFGGATVHTTHISGENSDGKGDTLYGTRANYRYKGILEIGLAGVHESNAPKLVSHASENYRRVGGDIWLSPLRQLEIIGHSSYNPETKEIAEHTYLLNIKPIQHIIISGEFNRHNERSYFYGGTTFSAAILNPHDKSSSTGLIASYEVIKNLELVADYKRYNREFGAADRFGGEVRTNFRDNTIRSGIAYHFLNAGPEFSIGSSPSASYHEMRCYIMHDSKSYFAAIDLLGDLFLEKIYGKTSALEATTSLGYHITPALALSGDLSYGRNPQFTEETRAILRLTYNTTYNGIGGKK